MPTEAALNSAAAILDRVARSLKGNARHAETLSAEQAKVSLMAAVRCAQIDVDKARNLVRSD